MNRKRVLVGFKEVPDSAVDMLSEHFDLVINTQDVPTRDVVLEQIRGVHALLWPKMSIDAEMLDAAGPQLETIASVTAGLDHIDLHELRKRSIKITSTSEVQSDTVSNMAVLLMLAASRRVCEAVRHVEMGGWRLKFDWMLGKDLKDSIVGIVGMGSIGTALAEKLKGFKVARIIYCGHSEKLDVRKRLGSEFVTFEDLLARSDFVVACCSLSDETRGMFNAVSFRKMKKGAVFVNVSRGEVVEQTALVKALKTGELFGAGLDVTVPEPLPADHELVQLSNCFITPHIGSATAKVRQNMAELAAKNIIKELLDSCE